MHVHSMATCVADTVATTYAAVLKPALGPVAPASLVAVDCGADCLALLRLMTLPANRLGLQLYPSRQKAGRPSQEKEYSTAGPPLPIDPGRRADTEPIKKALTSL